LANYLSSSDLGEAKVEYLHDAIESHLDVGWFQIPVNDALLVGRFEGLGQLPRNRQRLIDRNRTSCEAIRERRPLNQFHDERRSAS
jgi:hypothetical protein